MITYKKAGVDLNKAERFLKEIRRISKEVSFESPFKAFSSLFPLNKDTFLVLSCDGVGTKIKIAQELNIHYPIGIDLVAMNVNDIICTGAKPCVFLDYIAFNKVELKVLKEIMRGIVTGCKEATCILAGGETAEMPGVYKKGEYDLAGFCVGLVKKKDLVSPSNIKEGDLVLGLRSSGLHSNGFSLVRKVFTKPEILKYKKELLTPTRIYVKEVLAVLRKFKKKIKGLAHITGGAFLIKAPKVLPEGLSFVFYKKNWPVPKIFKMIQEKGKIEDKEMYRVFNMGIGFILIVSQKSVKDIFKFFKNINLDCYVIGEVIKAKEVILR